MAQRGQKASKVNEKVLNIPMKKEYSQYIYFLGETQEIRQKFNSYGTEI